MGKDAILIYSILQIIAAILMVIFPWRIMPSGSTAYIIGGISYYLVFILAILIAFAIFSDAKNKNLPKYHTILGLIFGAIYGLIYYFSISKKG